MKSKASLVLMEQLVMILVFALTACMCLNIFVQADRISRETGLRDRAVVLTQRGAETLKACEGDLEAAAEILGGVSEDGVLTVREGGLRLEAERMPAELAGLGQAEVRAVEEETGEILFSVTAAWQEVD